MRMLAIALMALAAQQTPAPAPLVSIEGVIVSQGTETPLSGVSVVLNEQSVTSGDDGRFSIPGVAPGTYRLNLVRAGYVRPPVIAVTVTPGQKVTDIRVAMKGTGAIAGRIVDRNGEPIERAQVQALRYSYANGARGLTIVQTVSTDDLGEYRLFWLPAGRYYVTALRSPASSSSGVRSVRVDSESEADVPIYYPGATDAGLALPIDVRAGSSMTGVNFNVAPVRVYRVRGVVTGAPPGAAGGVTLIPRSLPSTAGSALDSITDQELMRIVLGERSSPYSTAAPPGQIGPDGSFSIPGVVPGAYFLNASVIGGRNGMSGTVIVEVGDKDIENIAVPVTAGVDIPGTMVIEGNAAGNEQLARSITFRPDPPAGQSARSSLLISSGVFTVLGLQPGDYQVTVAASDNFYVKSMRLGGADVLYGLRLTSSTSGRLEIVLGSNPGAVEGKVINTRSEPTIGVTVVLVPEESRRRRTSLFKTASTDASGRFQLKGIAPGNYKVVAWEDVDSGAWLDPEFLRSYDERGKPVHIEEGSKESVEINVIVGL